MFAPGTVLVSVSVILFTGVKENEIKLLRGQALLSATAPPSDYAVRSKRAQDLPFHVRLHFQGICSPNFITKYKLLYVNIYAPKC